VIIDREEKEKDRLGSVFLLVNDFVKFRLIFFYPGRHDIFSLIYDKIVGDNFG